jgi:hypothetical protein
MTNQVRVIPNNDQTSVFGVKGQRRPRRCNGH